MRRPRGGLWLARAAVVGLLAGAGFGMTGCGGRQAQDDPLQQALAFVNAQTEARKAIGLAQEAQAEKWASTDWAVASAAVERADAARAEGRFTDAMAAYEQARLLAGVAASRAAEAERDHRQSREAVEALRKGADLDLAVARHQFRNRAFGEAAAALAEADARLAADDLAAARAGYEKTKALVKTGLETITSLRDAAKAAQDAAGGPMRVVLRAVPERTHASPEVGELILAVASHWDSANGEFAAEDFEKARPSFEAVKQEAEDVVKKLSEPMRAAEAAAREAQESARAAQAEKWANADWVAACAAIESAASNLHVELYIPARRSYLAAQQSFQQAAAKAAETAKKMDAAAGNARAAVQELGNGMVAFAAARQSRPMPGEVGPGNRLRAVQYAMQNLPPPVVKESEAASAALTAAEERLSALRFDEAEDRFAQAALRARRSLRMLKAVESPVTLRSTPGTFSRNDFKAMAMGGRFRLPGTAVGLLPDPADPKEEDFTNVFEVQERLVDLGEVSGLPGARQSKRIKLVIDHATGLMWTYGGTSIGPKKQAQVGEQVKAMNASSHGGFTDWRLPTVEELFSLIELKPNADGWCLDEALHFGWPAPAYWSSDKWDGPGPIKGFWGVQFKSVGTLYTIPDHPNAAPDVWVIAVRKR